MEFESNMYLLKAKCKLHIFPIVFVFLLYLYFREMSLGGQVLSSLPFVANEADARSL